MIIVLLISFGAFIATLLGGVFAIRFKDKLHLILGFSAGALIGAAFFDLLPESISVGTQYYSVSTMIAWVAAGIFSYLLISRCMGGTHDDAEGNAGALTLVVHSLFDGIAIGLASLVPATLPVVAAAVLAHDFSDGINTVNLVFRNDGKNKNAWIWLILDAVAPVVGAVTTRLFTIPKSIVGIVLAVLSGFFIYIGLSDLLPESYHGHPTRWTTIATVVGAAVIFGAVRLAGL
jgi:zinc transporter ZupT